MSANNFFLFDFLFFFNTYMSSLWWSSWCWGGILQALKTITFLPKLSSPTNEKEQDIHFTHISTWLAWKISSWQNFSDFTMLLLSFGISTKRQCIILRSHHNLGLISVIIGKGSLERPEQRKLQLKGSTVSVRNLHIPKCLPLLRCRTSVHHYVISDKAQVLYVCFPGSDLFIEHCRNPQQIRLLNESRSSKIFWRAAKGRHPKHTDLW